MYSLTNFKTVYIDCDFDTCLLDQNNILINSNQHYLDIKNNYLQQTKENFKQFTELLCKHTELSNNYNISNNDNLTTHSYQFVNIGNLQDINSQLKVLLINQQYLFENFNHYILFINSSETMSENIYHGDINQPQTIKINNKRSKIN